jgi:hypothetical protein
MLQGIAFRIESVMERMPGRKDTKDDELDKGEKDSQM